MLIRTKTRHIKIRWKRNGELTKVRLRSWRTSAAHRRDTSWRRDKCSWDTRHAGRPPRSHRRGRRRRRSWRRSWPAPAFRSRNSTTETRTAGESDDLLVRINWNELDAMGQTAHLHARTMHSLIRQITFNEITWFIWITLESFSSFSIPSPSPSLPQNPIDSNELTEDKNKPSSTTQRVDLIGYKLPAPLGGWYVNSNRF